MSWIIGSGNIPRAKNNLKLSCKLKHLVVMASASAAIGAGALWAETPSSSPFTWGETTQVAEAGWGRMLPLGGDNWLCVNTKYPRPSSVLQVEISHGRARTWKVSATVAEPGRNLDNGEIIKLPNGTLLLTGRSVVTSQVWGAVQSFSLPVYQSVDNGKKWTFLSLIARSEPGPFEPGQKSMGLWEPHFFLLPGGSVACAYADETLSEGQPAFSQIVSEKVSEDSGVTWGPVRVLASQIFGGKQRPGMPAVTRMKNGDYIAVFEVVGIGDADVYFKTSPDGITWPPGIGTPIAHQHAGPWVISLQSGRLMVTSCENQVSYSDDYGKTWLPASPPAVSLGHAFRWPAIYEVAPGQLAVMTSWHGVQIRWGKISEGFSGH